MEEKANTAVTGYLERLSPLQLVTDQKVYKKFVTLYDTIHGKGLGESIYQKEQFNFVKLLQENPVLQECSKLSLYGAFLDVAVNGLSLDTTSKPLCYMMSRNAKTKNADGKEVWEKRAYIKVSPSGEIFYRKRSGQIKNADNPQIVYEGDTIRVGLNSLGKHVVKEHERLIPRKPNARILGGYIRIERHDGSFECLWMDVSETERLREYSNRNNRGTETEDKSNKLYTSFNGQIDPGFFEAKITRHAFDSYPPVKLGAHSVLASHEEPVQDVNYELEENITQVEQGNKRIERPESNVNITDVTKETGAFGDTPKQPENTIVIPEEGGAF